MYRVPLAALTDPSLTAAARASRIAVVSPRPAGVVESLKALTFNRYDPADTRLYASAPIRQRLLRIHVGTGAREEILADGDLFDFPVGAAFLPPLVPGVTPMVVTSDQEYRLAALTPAIPADLFRPPFIVAKVFVAPPGARRALAARSSGRERHPLSAYAGRAQGRRNGAMSCPTKPFGYRAEPSKPTSAGSCAPGRWRVPNSTSQTIQVLP